MRPARAIAPPLSSHAVTSDKLLPCSIGSLMPISRARRRREFRDKEVLHTSTRGKRCERDGALTLIAKLLADVRHRALHGLLEKRGRLRDGSEKSGGCVGRQLAATAPLRHGIRGRQRSCEGSARGGVVVDGTGAAWLRLRPSQAAAHASRSRRVAARSSHFREGGGVGDHRTRFRLRAFGGI